MGKNKKQLKAELPYPNAMGKYKKQLKAELPGPNEQASWLTPSEILKVIGNKAACKHALRKGLDPNQLTTCKKLSVRCELDVDMKWSLLAVA